MNAIVSTRRAVLASAISARAVPEVAERLVAFTAHAGLPAALRDRLHEALRAAMANPAVKGKLEDLGNDTRVGTPAEFRARVEADLTRWRPFAHVVNQS